MDKFTEFLNKLRTKDNKSLIEAIQKGFKTITEGYADVREEPTVGALDTFNNKASMYASSMGNHILSFLQNSKDQYKDLYVEDTEPELDKLPTSLFCQFSDEDDEKAKKADLGDELGLTAREISLKNGTNRPTKDFMEDFSKDFGDFNV
jgi:hypothetical protein